MITSLSLLIKVNFVMLKKLHYYPLLPDKDLLGAERSDYVLQWIEQYLKPQGLITDNEEQANAYLVAAGDGGMTKAAQEKSASGKVLFGINCGTLGFLMNQINDPKQIPHCSDDMNLIKLNMIDALS